MYQLKSLRRADYEEKLNQLECKSTPCVARANLCYGIQPEQSMRDKDPISQEYDMKKIKRQARSMIEANDIYTLPLVKIVTFRGTLVVIDGHHRVRAYGLVNSCKMKQGGFPIPIIRVEEIPLIEYLNLMEWTKEDFLFIVRYAAGTFVEAMQIKNYSNLSIMLFQENMGTGVVEA